MCSQYNVTPRLSGIQNYTKKRRTTGRDIIDAPPIGRQRSLLVSPTIDEAIMIFPRRYGDRRR